MLENIAPLLRRHAVMFIVFRDDELEHLQQDEPGSAAETTRSVIADMMMKERDIVLRRLRQMGVNVVDVPVTQMNAGVIDLLSRHETAYPVATMSEQLSLKSHRFRAEREADWLRLEALLKHLEAGRRKALSDDDVIALPVLYRATLSSLSMARAISLDRSLVAYLESLSTRAYFLCMAAAPLAHGCWRSSSMTGLTRRAHYGGKLLSPPGSASWAH